MTHSFFVARGPLRRAEESEMLNNAEKQGGIIPFRGRDAPLTCRFNVATIPATLQPLSVTVANLDAHAKLRPFAALERRCGGSDLRSRFADDQFRFHDHLLRTRRLGMIDPG